MEIPFRGPDMGMTHESLNGSKVISVIQKGCGKGMPHHMGVNPLLDQGLFYHGLDEAVNRFVCKSYLRCPSLFGKGEQ
jgi:hypothetical protein